MRWINANKRKPESGKLVLIYTPGRTILGSPVLMGIYWEDDSSWIVYDWDRERDRIVTHWGEIPKPPL